MKYGKTSFAAQLKRNLFLATEIGYHAIDGINALPILKWSDFKGAVRELKDPRARELYDTVTIDTISILADLCEKYICAREGVDKINLVPYGQGWKMVAKELQDSLREITMLGFGLILICHSKEKATGYTDSEGNPLTSVEPDLSKNIYTVCNAICDLIAYINVEFDSNGKAQRWLYTRQTPTIFAGSRWKYLDERIPFGYNELVNAIDRAIEKQKIEDGATVVEHAAELNASTRSFPEIMGEAKELWETYLNGGATEEEQDYRYNMIRDIITRIFGSDSFKLSSAVPSQSELVEMFIEELKELIKEP